MTDEIDALRELATELFADHCTTSRLDAAQGGWDPKLWDALCGSGLHAIGVREELGGAGGTALHAGELLLAAGAAAAPVPLAESLFVGGWLRDRAGIPVDDRPVAVVAPAPSHAPVVRTHDDSSVHVQGSVGDVAFASVCDTLLVVAEDPARLLVVPAHSCEVTPSTNLAGEPRDTVVLDVRLAADAVHPLDPAVTAEDVRQRHHLARALQTAGALRRVADLTVAYASEREQFGRPIARFQAVGHALARLVGEAGACEAISRRALRAADDPRLVLAARVRAAMAAGRGAALAHQVHGAIGLTSEYVLQHLTRRLWSWRDDEASQREVGRALGSQVLSGDDDLWTYLTA